MCTVVATHSLDSSGGQGIKTIRDSAEVHQRVEFPSGDSAKNHIGDGFDHLLFFADIAQQVEHLTCNEKVLGSIPSVGIFFY